MEDAAQSLTSMKVVLQKVLSNLINVSCVAAWESFLCNSEVYKCWLICFLWWLGVQRQIVSRLITPIVSCWTLSDRVWGSLVVGSWPIQFVVFRLEQPEELQWAGSCFSVFNTLVLTSPSCLKASGNCSFILLFQTWLLFTVFQLKYIDELESAVHALLQQRATSALKRRQDDLKMESAYMQHLAG